ncbi:MAG: vanadium-dependent haloperoxidase [Burkholderiaceae bacterium]
MSNARLLAIAAQAMDDAIVSVFEAKYHYRFWRPETAIANGDADGNDATQAVAGWASFIPAPMHPEYPCAHCIVSATLAGVIERELNGSPSPRLSTTSAALPGVEHSWETPRAFAQEVSESRIAGGIHYRNSTEVGQAMGARVAELAFERALGK